MYLISNLKKDICILQEVWGTCLLNFEEVFKNSHQITESNKSYESFYNNINEYYI